MRRALLVLALAPLAATAATPDAGAPPPDVVALTHRFFAASDGKELAALAPLLHQDFAFARPGAKRLSTQEYLTLVQKRGGSAVARTWSEESVTLEPEVALYSGTAHTTVDGAASDVGLTLVWAKDAGAWKVLLVQPRAAGTEATRERWNAMLKGAPRTPSKLLVETVSRRTPGKALDLGMGNGRNALWLAERGWKVTGVEIAEAGALACWQAAQEKGLSNLAVVLQDARHFDFGVEQWDLVALLYVPVGDSAAAIVKALKPGGVVVLEAFHADGAGARPTGDNVLFELEQVKKAFAGLKVLKAEAPVDVAEWGGDRRKLVRFVVEKPR